MSSTLNLPSEPLKNIVNQQSLLTTMVFDSAQNDKKLLSDLINNPAKVLIAAGFSLQEKDAPDFNKYCREDKDISALLTHLSNGGELEQLTGWKCTVCKSTVYPIALGIVAVGAGALATLTVTSGVVVALAAFAGVAAATALSFIVGLAAAVTGGVGVVASEICGWIGACG